MGFIRVRIHTLYPKENRICETRTHGAKKRGLYKQPTYRNNGSRFNANGQDDLRNGYGVIYNGTIQTAGNGDTYRDIFEVPEFPVDNTRAGYFSGNGKSYRV